MIATLHQIFGALVVANFFLAIIATELYQLLHACDMKETNKSEGANNMAGGETMALRAAVAVASIDGACEKCPYEKECAENPNAVHPSDAYCEQYALKQRLACLGSPLITRRP